MIGRSNVGKSSLINKLTNRNKLARVSANPGCTRQINFFNLGDRMMLVDVPGYGFAKASKTQIAAWIPLLSHYLRGRVSLKRVFVLIDSRRGVKAEDAAMMEMLDNHAVSYQLVLTKVDKAEAGERAQRLEEFSALRSRHPAMHPDMLLTSADTREGVDVLRQAIWELIEGQS